MQRDKEEIGREGSYPDSAAIDEAGWWWWGRRPEVGRHLATAEATPHEAQCTGRFFQLRCLEHMNWNGLGTVAAQEPLHSAISETDVSRKRCAGLAHATAYSLYELEATRQ